MTKFIVYILFINILFFYGCKKIDYVDERSGLEILFYPEKNMFPFDWYYGEVSAKVKALSLKEIDRSKVAIDNALSKYPVKVLTDNLKKIFVFRQLNFYGVDYAGTYSEDLLYLANSGVENGYSLSFLEQSFHHEFSSVLYWNNYLYFDKEEWLAANENEDSIYFDDLGGAGAMISGQDSDSFDEYYHEMGFLYEYATSSFENDFNSFAENLFKSETGFWELSEKYERIKRKIDIIIDFYHQIDTVFTEDYFIKISKE
ncbi:MAG: hypothetical protein ABIJ97_09715 [Bacteroidota bacterium]